MTTKSEFSRLQTIQNERTRQYNDISFKGNDAYLWGLVGPQGILDYKNGNPAKPFQHKNRVFTLTYFPNPKNTQQQVSILLNPPVLQSDKDSQWLFEDPRPTPFITHNGYRASTQLFLPSNIQNRQTFARASILMPVDGSKKLTSRHAGSIFSYYPSASHSLFGVGLEQIQIDYADKNTYPFITYHLVDDSALVIHSDEAHKWIK